MFSNYVSSSLKFQSLSDQCKRPVISFRREDWIVSSPLEFWCSSSHSFSFWTFKKRLLTPASHFLVLEVMLLSRYMRLLAWQITLKSSFPRLFGEVGQYISYLWQNTIPDFELSLNGLGGVPRTCSYLLIDANSSFHQNCAYNMIYQRVPEL